MASVSALHLHSRDPIIPSQIRRRFPRPAAEHVATIARFPATDVSDLVGRFYTTQGIKPLYQTAPALCATAVTVKCPPGDNLGVVKAISSALPGDVLVIDAQGFTTWCLGGFQLLRAAVEDYGLAGFVMNGAYRDIEDAEQAGFALYGVGVSAWSGPKAGPFEINVPVCCGGVIVHPGDIISASAEGVVVVPRAYSGAVADKLVETLEAGKSSADKKSEATAVSEFIRKVDAHINDVFEQGGGVYIEEDL
ncbi:RraA family protein [Chelatococcus sp. GCM10030263]|uniref:RraA family protein n=1 Tax=Chelatococcus sp. GCM10030263 TaxID=3273387 RepID=UPI003612D19A